MRRALLLLALVLAAASASAADESFHVEASTEQRLAPPVALPVQDDLRVEAETALPRVRVPTVGEAGSGRLTPEDAPVEARVGGDEGTEARAATGHGLRLDDSGFFENGELDLSSFHGQNGDTAQVAHHAFLNAREADRTVVPEPASAHSAGAWTRAEEAADGLPRVTYRTHTRVAALEIQIERVAETVFATAARTTHQVDARAPSPAKVAPAQEPEATTPPFVEGTAITPPPERPPHTTTPPVSASAVGTATGWADGTAVLAAAAAAASALGLLLALALYSLLGSKDVLKNPVRAKIFAVVEEHPGITVAMLAERVGVKHQTVSYHLNFLVKAGYVTDHARGNKRLLFANGAGFTADDRAILSVASHPTAIRILDAIAASPSMLKTEVAEAIGLTRTGGAWHVKRLIDAGIVAERRAHGHCLLTVDPQKLARVAALVRR